MWVKNGLTAASQSPAVSLDAVGTNEDIYMKLKAYKAQNIKLSPIPLTSCVHYRLEFWVSKILNVPLLSPSQIAPKFHSSERQYGTKNQAWVEADSLYGEF